MGTENWFPIGCSDKFVTTTFVGTANREGTHMEISFWLGKGDIPNEKNRLPPLEVHFGVGGCGRTDSAGGAGQE